MAEVDHAVGLDRSRFEPVEIGNVSTMKYGAKRGCRCGRCV